MTELEQKALYLSAIKTLEKVRDLCEDKIYHLIKSQENRKIIEMNIYREGIIDKFFIQTQYLRYKVNHKDFQRGEIELTYKNITVKTEVLVSYDYFIESSVDKAFNMLYIKLADNYKESPEVRQNCIEILYGY